MLLLALAVHLGVVPPLAMPTIEMDVQISGVEMDVQIYLFPSAKVSPIEMMSRSCSRSKVSPIEVDVQISCVVV